MDVPRRLYWSGGNCGHVDLGDEDQVALAYEAIIDNAHSAAELIRFLDAELLARVWPTLGITLDRKRRWTEANPVLDGMTAATAA